MQHPVASAVLSLLALRTRLHVAHLAARTRSEHHALNDAYDAVEDAADKLAEQAIGLNIPFPDPGVNYVAEMERAVSMLRSLSEESEDTVMQNTASELAGTLSQQLYLLRMD